MRWEPALPPGKPMEPGVLYYGDPPSVYWCRKRRTCTLLSPDGEVLHVVEFNRVRHARAKMNRLAEHWQAVQHGGAAKERALEQAGLR